MISNKEITLFAEKTKSILEKSTSDLGHLTKLDLLSTTISLTGLAFPKPPHGLPPEKSRTLSLIYPPTEGNDGHYDTTWTIAKPNTWPEIFFLSQDNNQYKITSSGKTFASDIKLNHIFTTPTDFYWYYPESPTELAANPNHTCTEGCTLCSRKLLKGFDKNHQGYIHRHVSQIDKEFETKFRNSTKLDLAYVHITTGSQATPDQELDMMKKIMETYKEHGYTNAAFSIYSSMLPINSETLRILIDLSMDTYGTVLEVISDDLRGSLWGKHKGNISLKEQVDKNRIAYNVLSKIGGHTTVQLVLGLEDIKTTLSALDLFPESQIQPSVFRPYNRGGLQLISSDVWNMGPQYYIDILNTIIERNQKLVPVDTRVETAKEWLRNHDFPDHISRRRMAI